MPASLDPAAICGVLAGVCREMVSAQTELTHADQAIGDGDHGLAIARGFRAVEAALDAPPTVAGASPDLGALFSTVGTTLLMSMGGASGAIYGTLFRSGAGPLLGRTSFDADALAEFLRAGLEGVQQRGKASVGDKTLVDALAPAAAAASLASTGDLGPALEAAVTAAEGGLEATRGLRASIGKAKTLGDRALGYPDPGALSFTIMLRALARLVKEAAATRSEAG